MSDRTPSAEHPRALSPLVEAVRLENAIWRKRRQVEKLATKLQDAEFERQVFERELIRLRSVIANGGAPCAAVGPLPGPEGGDAGKAVTPQDDYNLAPAPCHPAPADNPRETDSAECAAVGAQVVPGLDPGSAPTVEIQSAPNVGGDASAGTTRMDGSTHRDVAAGRDRQLPHGDPRRFHPGFKDETGNRYGSLLVVARAPNVNGNARWRCRCDCGAESVAAGIALRAGSASCATCRTKTAPTCSFCGEQGHTSAGCHVRPGTTKHRAVRCAHGFMPGLCEASGCAHRRANGGA